MSDKRIPQQVNIKKNVKAKEQTEELPTANNSSKVVDYISKRNSSNASKYLLSKASRESKLYEVVQEAQQNKEKVSQYIESGSTYGGEQAPKITENAPNDTKKLKADKISLPESDEKNNDYLSPNKRTEDMGDVTITSQVSNPYAIKIMEDHEGQEFLNSKSRNSSLKLAVEKVKQEIQDNIKENDGEQQVKGAIDKEKEELEKHAIADELRGSKVTESEILDPKITTEPPESNDVKKPLKKKKKKKKKVKKSHPEDANAHEEQPVPKPDSQEKPVNSDNNDLPEELDPHQHSPIPKEKVKLDGIEDIPKPLNLDKLLLSNQSNGVIPKPKKK